MLDAGNAGAPAPTPATPSPEPAPAALMPAVNPEADLDKELSAIWDKHNPERDDGGRFASKDTGQEPEAETPAPEAVTTDQPAAEEPEPAAPAIEPPNAWSAEMKAKWATLPPDAQAYIAQREGEAHKAITRAGEERQAFEPYRNVIESHRDVFQRNGYGERPHEGVAAMLQIERALQANPVGTIGIIAKAYGVDLSRLAGGQPPAGQQPPTDPRYAALEGRLNQLTGHLQAQHMEAESRAKAELAQTITEFSKDKSDWSELEDTVVGQIVSIRALSPKKGHAEVLKEAYAAAQRIHPEVSKRLAEEARKAEEVRKAEEAKKAAEKARAAGSVNVKGTPAAGGKPKTMDETIEELGYRLMRK